MDKQISWKYSSDLFNKFSIYPFMWKIYPKFLHQVFMQKNILETHVL